MNNVLIIGNGFDRQLGLKTDYISFLDWIESQNYSEVGLDNLLNIIYEFNQLNGSSIAEITGFIDAIISDRGYSAVRDFKLKLFNKQTYTNENEYSLRLFKLIILTKKQLPTTKIDYKTNIWFSYFNFLRKFVSKKDQVHDNLLSILFLENINDMGRWIDLESLIESNIRQIINTPSLTSATYINIYSFAKYLLLCDGQIFSGDYPDYKNKINDFLWNDFLEFKNLLVNYLEESFTTKSYCEEINFPIEKFMLNKIINFNYTNTVRELIDLGYLTQNKTDIYYVHGSIEDKSNIVFGLDSFFRDLPAMDSTGRSSDEIKLLNDDAYMKFSKIHQLLALQKEKESFNIGQVDKLLILGHSVGVQDYSYFYSIFDRNIDKIIIEYYYYNYSNGDGNNKISGQDAIFRLLNSYEKYSSKRVFHKMIFEGRIKFKEIPLQKIFD